jgi:hypothetical protein
MMIRRFITKTACSKMLCGLLVSSTLPVSAVIGVTINNPFSLAFVSVSNLHGQNSNIAFKRHDIHNHFICSTFAYRRSFSAAFTSYRTIPSKTVLQRMCDTQTNLGETTLENLQDFHEPDHQTLVLWVLSKMQNNPTRQTTKAVQRELASLEITSKDVLLCIRLLSKIKWSVASDHAADALLKCLGSLLDGHGLQPENSAASLSDSEDDEPADIVSGAEDVQDDIRKEMKQLAKELIHSALDVFNETDFYLHPKALLKLMRLARYAIGAGYCIHAHLHATARSLQRAAERNAAWSPPQRLGAS